MSRLPKSLLLIAAVVLVLDTIAAVAYSGWVRVPEEVSRTKLVKEAGRAIGDYYRQLAASAGVQGSKSVQKALGVMEAALRGKNTMAEITAALLNHSAAVEAAILSEQRRRQREIILRIIGGDPKVRVTEKGTIVLSGGEVLEGEEFLGAVSLEKLKSEPALAGSAELVTVEVVRGKASVGSHPRHLEYFQHLEAELEQLKRQLQRVQEEAGFLPLEGPGVVVEAADAPGGYLWEEIVHDQDIREIINNLRHAGARGIEVGGQRLGCDGWVRCVGPVVVVNGETVAANPIVVKAVGEPAGLKESLKGLQEVFARTGKQLHVEERDSITLTAR